MRSRIWRALATESSARRLFTAAPTIYSRTEGQGGLVGFELAGGLAAGRRFIDVLQLFYYVANIGDARSLAIHPGSTTHSQLNEAEQLASVCHRVMSVSPGIEHISDILADIDQALVAAA